MLLLLPATDFRSPAVATELCCFFCISRDKTITKALGLNLHVPHASRPKRASERPYRYQGERLLC